MRIRVMTWLAAVVLLLLLIPAAQAEQVEIKFTGATAGGNCNGDLCDPYQFIVGPVNGNFNDGNTLWLNCDDFHDTIVSGDTWIADVIYGSDTANLLNTRMSKLNPTWTETDAAKAYDAKAYLEMNYSPADNPDYTVALWRIFDSSVALTGNSSTLYNAAIAAANTDGADYLTYRQHLTIYTPTAEFARGGWPQELNSVPDGGLTVMLLGGALVGLEALRRRFHV